KIPAGYEVCEKGDINFCGVEDVNVKVRKVAAQTRNVRVHYVSESGEMIEDNIEELTIPADQTVVKAADLKKIPAGYEVCEKGDINFCGVEDVNVKVRKVAAQTRNVRVHYVSESGEMIEDNIEELTIPADQTVVKAADLKKIPAGYEVCEKGDINFCGVEDVNVKVRKVAAQTR
ncbi:hypothetical protein, partial [Bulleidia sp. HCP3S3_C9]|uniref:hypothetical protein n=1 Tax=Bulleidia sp. HCP3S3_C9 TaxID=3438914 RepID=UPI003F88654B